MLQEIDRIQLLNEIQLDLNHGHSPSKKVIEQLLNLVQSQQVKLEMYERIIREGRHIKAC